MISLNDSYSTTRLLSREYPEIDKKPDDKPGMLMSLLENESRNRQGEGGLRTQGFYKNSFPDKPLITVVTVVFNEKKRIEDTILSIINQTYDNVEYIIIDGGSVDGTVNIIRKYEHAVDYWVSEMDDGIYDAMNKGSCLATGEWVNFMNGGDSFVSNIILSNIRIALRKNKILFGRAKIIDSHNRSWNYPEKNIFHSDIAKWLKRNCPNHQAMFFPKCYYSINQYDTKYPVTADSHYKNKSLKEVGYIFFDDYIASFYTGGVSTCPSLKMTLEICQERFRRKDFKYRYNDYMVCVIKALLKICFYKIFGEKSMFVISRLKRTLSRW